MEGKCGVWKNVCPNYIEHMFCKCYYVFFLHMFCEHRANAMPLFLCKIKMGKYSLFIKNTKCQPCVFLIQPIFYFVGILALMDIITNIGFGNLLLIVFCFFCGNDCCCNFMH